LPNERRSTMIIPIRNRDCRIRRPREGWDAPVLRKARLRFFHGADPGCIQLAPVGSIPSRRDAGKSDASQASLRDAWALY